MKIAVKALTALFVLALFMGIISGFAMAGAPPGVPTIPPSGGGGGGGGGGGSGVYNPPVEIYPKIVPVKNSLGTVIGNVTAKSASDISVSIEQQVTVNGQTYTVHIDAKLNSMPSDPKLDIVGETPDSSKLPSELTLGNILTQINLTRFSSGWSIQGGSLKLTLKIPKALAENADLSKSVMVRYDGTSYELLHASSMGGPDENGIITYAFTSPHETFGYNSFSEYMLVTGVSLPSPTPTPVATATPAPEGGLDTLTVLLALILVALVAGAFVLYFVMQRKQ